MLVAAAAAFAVLMRVAMIVVVVVVVPAAALAVMMVVVTITAAGAIANVPTFLYVDANADQSPHDGSDWCHAYVHLYEALALAAPGTTIRIADGTYEPDTSGLGNPREAAFSLVDGVATEGGYAGCGAPDPDARHPTLYRTILSGDRCNLVDSSAGLP